MHLVLTREYWPTGTNGSLSLDGKEISKTIEAPAAQFEPSLSCLREGIYLLNCLANPPKMAFALFKDRIGLPLPDYPLAELNASVQLDGSVLQRNIVMVSEITGEGRGLPSLENLQKLFSLIGQILLKSERAILEIRSCPEHALNLTCHCIEWMD